MHGFTLVWEQDVAECKSRARLWKHEATGAELLSFCNADENKVFGVSFRTPPEDSTGLPHILEHSVLCGSEKYPVKEPFVELLKGSLQTFLNAFTYPDKTCYPVASTNARDFRNLTDVYLDAVFFPRITEEIFQQEGWHLEKGPDGSFVFKGVVYNEMKGVFSSPESVLSRHSLHALFPDTVYGLESGGEPEVIPSLTYEQFMRFHRAFYHPSNGRFYFWGDDAEEERLEQLGMVLSRFSKQDPAPAIELQQLRPAPSLLEVPYASGDGEDKGMVACNWLLSEGSDVELTLSLRMLEHILLGMPASPLRRALIESGLGEDLAGDGLEDDLRQLIFSVGLRGVEPGKAQDVELLIMETLAGLAEEGIPALAVEAAVNSVEFSLRENNTGRFPVGLSVMLQALTTWLHDGDPLAPLRYEAPLARIKAKLAAKDPYFERLIQKWLLDNSHRATVVLLPDAALAKRKDETEAERVAERVSPLSEKQKDELEERAERLRRLQEEPDKPEDLARIPRLGTEDMPRSEKPIPSEKPGAAVPLFFHDLPTSGISYVEAFFDLAALPQELFPLLPLFGRALLEMGTKERDFVNLNMTIACKTGGMDISPLVLTHQADRSPLPRLVLSGKTTPDKVADLFGLLREVLTEARFDDAERFGRMVLEEKARLEHSLVPSGHALVSARLQGALSAGGQMGECLQGVSALLFVRGLVERLASDWPGVLADLERIRSVALTRANLTCNITGESQRKAQLLEETDKLANALPQGATTAPAAWKPPVLPLKEALLLPAQVNYVGRGANLYDLGYRYSGSVHVILKHLRTGWLWEKVRVQGGAYGAFCSLDRLSGGFVLVSYRDPNVAATLDTFARTADHLKNLTLSERDLSSAIVGAIGEMDSYLLPDAKGMASFTRQLCGDTPESRQRMRDEILGTTQKDFREFGEAVAAAMQQGRCCALGGSALEQVAKDQNWEMLRLL